MHLSYEGGILENPWEEPPKSIFLLTRSPEEAPDDPIYIEIDFEKGEAVAINDEKIAPVGLLSKLNELGGEHAIGRVDIVENRMVGMKSRGVYETPGVTILQKAHRALASLTMDREVMRLRDSLNTKISEMIYYGFWFSPEFDVIKMMVEETQKTVTGRVRIKLYKGNCTIVGRKSTSSLYSSELATYSTEISSSNQIVFLPKTMLKVLSNSMLYVYA